MNIVEFLSEIGHEKLTFQFLHQCVSNATLRRGGTSVTFSTTEMSPGDLVMKPRKIGIIVWTDNEDFERVKAML